jgi:uncharacterized protein (DUF302 family)
VTGTDEVGGATYAIAVTVDRPFAPTLAATRDALAAQGFGVLSEIDMRATLKAKLNVEIAPQTILGACRPPLAHAALQAEPSIGLLLPCNVVIRTLGDGHTRVETVDPETMVSITGNPELQAVATEARARLSAALDSLGRPHSAG